jgi:hypothetical protein
MQFLRALWHGCPARYENQEDMGVCAAPAWLPPHSLKGDLFSGLLSRLQIIGIDNAGIIPLSGQQRQRLQNESPRVGSGVVLQRPVVPQLLSRVLLRTLQLGEM